MDNTQAVRDFARNMVQEAAYFTPIAQAES
jgi:hypothetical protein